MEYRKSFFGGTARTPLTNTARPSAVGTSTSRKNYPDPRPSMATGRPSLTSDARCSFAGGASLGYRPSAIPGAMEKRIVTVPKKVKIQDDRNLRDRETQSEIIAKIVNFLADCYNPNPPFKFDDRHFLRVPNRNDFKNVYEFIVQCIQPSYQVVGKLEEDVVKFMSNFGFPYAFLKPSTIQTMTTPTCWPFMLVILEWLVDIVEKENEIHTENKIEDSLKWHLLTSCYKHKLNANPTKQEVLTFDQEFEIYRKSKIGDEDDDDAFDELRARRIACAEKLKVVENEIEEEKGNIIAVEKTISDLELDIGSLQKYCTDLVVKASQSEQMLVLAKEANESLLRTIDKLNGENLSKEQQIAAQKLSGNEARQLMTKRNSIREEISLIRNRLSQAEEKSFELQPKFYKQSAKVRTDYNALMSGLRGLCESLYSSKESQQIVAKLDRYHFDEAFLQLQKTGSEDELGKITTQLKDLSGQRILAYKSSEESAVQNKANLLKEIRELQSAKERVQTKQELDFERAKRGRDDEMRPVNDLKHNLDLVKQNRKTTADALKKFTDQLNDLHEKLAEKHKKYIDYKRQLDSQYSDLQSVVLGKMEKLYDRFQQIQDQKARFEELANSILRENAKAIQK